MTIIGKNYFKYKELHMSSGPKIGNRKKGNGRAVKLIPIKELYKLVRTAQGKDRLKCQNELIKRRYPIIETNI